MLVPRARFLRETRPPRGFCATAHLGPPSRAPLRGPPRRTAQPGCWGLGVRDSALPGRCPAAPGLERALLLRPRGARMARPAPRPWTPGAGASRLARPRQLCSPPAPPLLLLSQRGDPGHKANQTNHPERPSAPSPCPSPAHARGPPAVSPAETQSADLRLIYAPARLRARGHRDHTWALTDPGDQEQTRLEQGLHRHYRATREQLHGALARPPQRPAWSSTNDRKTRWPRSYKLFPVTDVPEHAH